MRCVFVEMYAIDDFVKEKGNKCIHNKYRFKIHQLSNLSNENKIFLYLSTRRQAYVLFYGGSTHQLLLNGSCCVWIKISQIRFLYKLLSIWYDLFSFSPRKTWKIVLAADKVYFSPLFCLSYFMLLSVVKYVEEYFCFASILSLPLHNGIIVIYNRNVSFSNKILAIQSY